MYTNKPTLGKLRKMYRIATIHTGWTAIFRSNRKKFDPSALKILNNNNAQGMIKSLQTFIDEARASFK